LRKLFVNRRVITPDSNGLDENQLLDQANKIVEINDRIKQGQSSIKRHVINNFKVLSGAEVNIMKDGSLDVLNALDKLDLVRAAVHSNFAQPIDVQTNRLIKAAMNPSVDILFHPTDRRINKREGYPVDIQKQASGGG